MNIQFIEPFARAFRRMKKALFQPFDIKKWFVVGFTAFLAGLTDCHGSSGGNWKGNKAFNLDGAMNFPGRTWDWWHSIAPGWMALLIVLAAVLIVFAVVMVWVSSRGKFMFLDNVLYDRAQVVKPWHDYKAEGNSLFLWALSFGVIVLAIVVTYVVQCFQSLHALYEQHGESMLLLGPALWMILGFAVIVAILMFIELLLSHFVVPIMYRYKIKTMAAWSYFFRIFFAYPIHFVGYSFIVLLLMIFVVIAVFLLGFMTCCIGFLILAIPYINKVILLPVRYTFRAYSVEFLGQFGPEYRLFPDPGTPSQGAATS
jgi:hypothetical protein